MAEKIKPNLKKARKRTKNAIETTEYHFNPAYEALGNGRTYFIETHGCQANEADTERLRGLLEKAGFSEGKKVETSDVVIINTCAVRKTAENKVFGEIGRLKGFKRKHDDMILAIGGCMPQEENVTRRLTEEFDQVDIVFGTHNLHRFLDLLARKLHGDDQVVEVMSKEGNLVEEVPAARESRFKAWVDIMHGCDEFCTYCIVPYTRGRERSRKPEYIKKEVQDLIDRGYKEVTLLGQNVNSYGLDFKDTDYGFADLLRDLSKTAIPRIRFTTSHPKDFTDDIIEVLATGGNLMPYIHLPVQSGSDRVLKRMNRKYTKHHYLDRVRKIKTSIPGVSISTDIIVGFPGETEADFEDTMELVETVGFEGAFTFIYSPREGTPAATYPDTVTREEKKLRLMRLNKVVAADSLKGNKRFEGETVSVLVEGPSKTNKDKLTGYTPYHKRVNFTGDEKLIGQIVDVHITEAKTWSLDGVADEAND